MVKYFALVASGSWSRSLLQCLTISFDRDMFKLIDQIYSLTYDPCQNWLIHFQNLDTNYVLVILSIKSTTISICYNQHCYFECSKVVRRPLWVLLPTTSMMRMNLVQMILPGGSGCSRTHMMKPKRILSGIERIRQGKECLKSHGPCCSRNSRATIKRYMDIILSWCPLWRPAARSEVRICHRIV